LASREVRAALDDPHPYVRATAMRALGPSPDVVDTLIARLSDPDRSVRDAAAYGLGRIGDARALIPLLDVWATTGVLHPIITLARAAGTEALVASVTARDRRAVASARVLGELRAEEAARALTSAIDATDDALVQAAITALGQLGAPSAVEAIVARLSHSNRNVRFAAVEALGRIRGARAVKALLGAAARREGELRAAVLHALSRDPPVQARDLFVAALMEHNVMCEYAARALARLRDPSTAGALKAAFQRHTGSRQLYLADALGALGDRTAVDVLCRELASERSGYPRIDLRAANALGRIGDARAIPTLSRVFEEALAFEDLPLLDVTARALGRIGARGVTGLLARALGIPDDSVQRSVVWALGRTSDPAAAEALARHLTSAPRSLYGAVARALCEVAPVSMSGTLIGFLRADDYRVRNAAGRRLAALGEVMLDELASCLRHADVRGRRRAAWALRTIGSERARAILDTARDDHDVRVRARAGVRRRG
jgi:HEAT repeat protein